VKSDYRKLTHHLAPVPFALSSPPRYNYQMAAADPSASFPAAGAAAAGALDWAHPIVREWFLERFASPTEPQELGWPHILARRTTVISAPTGSGKTLAAFLACIDRLVRKALTGALQDTTEVLYVSPLKALGNDIQKNLELPLGEILCKAAERGLLMPEIRVGVRTGDTLMHERRKMLVRPPHILVTTPESLYILLTAEKSRAILRHVETVIVDEIHAVADDKRGAHLALSLERLEALLERPPVRIGLSATQKPIELIAQFLAGNSRPAPVIVDTGHGRRLDIAIEVPPSELGPVASNEMWGEIYDRIAALVLQHRSTLVFVNTRRLSERVAHHLAERLGKEAVAAHHGSLSRKLRLAAERKLKAGEVRVLVATASLELGIDIGYVDLVCQIGSPRAIAVALQRIGRAGHWRGAIPKGRIFATTLDELVECAAVVRSVRAGELDRLEIPANALDVLAQQIVAACAAEDWREDDLYDLICRAYPYRALPRADFDAIVEMLSEGIAARRGRYSAYLFHDRVNHRIKGRRGSRLAAITSGGAIPENALYSVVAAPDDTPVGTVDEDFAVESLAGDIMLLGNSSWRIRRIQAGRVLVEDAQGAPPSVPFWRGEAPARTAELSAQVSWLREEVARRTAAPVEKRVDENGGSGAQAACKDWLKQQCGLDDAGAEQIIKYISSGIAVLGAVPSQELIIAERFFDEGGGMQLVIHAPFGARINKAWGLALRKKFCRSFNFELQAAATDNGLNISLGEQHSFPLADVFRYLLPASVQQILEQAVLAAPLFAVRWRWAAGRALALLRFQGGKKIAPQIQRMRAEDLLAAVFPQALACQENIVGDIAIPDHPLVRETMKDVLTEALDIEGLKRVLTDLAEGRIKCLAVDTPVPSAFSHEILNANPYAYLDDAPLEERRARAVNMRRALPESLASELGRLDPAAIDQVRRDAWPDVRDADELHDALLTFVALPEAAQVGSPQGAALRALEERLLESVAQWQPHFTELTRQNRATRAELDGRTYWVCAERAGLFRQMFGAASFAHPLPDIGEAAPSQEDALLAMITGWMSHSGPTTAGELGDLLGIPPEQVDKALLRLEAGGSILRGQFTSAAGQETEWCERRLLARIHRLTVGELRKQVQPVTPAQLMRWLLRWQHAAPGTQLTGERGLLEILRQLQGFEAAANSWEHQILKQRLAGYAPQVLDHLCLTGAVGWGRLSPHPATLETVTSGGRRVIPTSVAPIAFFVRDDADWMAARRGQDGLQAQGLSAAAREVHAFLRERGASFFPDIVRGTGRLKAEVETGLWELVTAGLITADGFDNLRALIDPKRRAGQGSGRSARPRHSSGRWSLLYTDGPPDRAADRVDDRDRALEAICGVLLRRYGVVFREVLVRESILPPWRELLGMLRRLEGRGEVRGGRFVTDFLGEQFALPIAVESLRAMRREPALGERVTVSAADPLNLVGIVVPGDRVAANSGAFVTFRDGAAADDLAAPIAQLSAAL
jgi:ATP-dependent helicase Lhr and Lhr-like helicase